MSTAILSGSGTTNVADVDDDFQLQATGPQTAAAAGFATIGTEENPEEEGIGRATKALEADLANYLRLGADTQVFYEPFLGTAVNTTQWTSVLTTMTVAASNTALVLNNGNSVAATAVARVQSYNWFSLFDSFETYFSFEYLYPSFAPIANTVFEAGAFISSGVTAPTDGVYLRHTQLGIVECVINFNGIETSQTIDTPSMGERHRVVIALGVSQVDFWIDDVLVATIETTEGRPWPVFSGALPLAFRVYNGAIGPQQAAAPQIFGPGVSYGSPANFRDTETTAALAGAMACQGQTGGTIGQTASYANNAVPTNAVLSNTTASYNGFLGGQYRFAAPAGVETDYVLFAYQAPAVAAGGNNKKLVITAVRIATWNEVVAVATTATVVQWSMTVGSTAVSLLTVNGNTTKAQRRVTLGTMTFPVGSAVGAGPLEGNLIYPLGSPLVVNPGEFVQIILKIPVGTATATEFFRGVAAFDGYWE